MYNVNRIMRNAGQRGRYFTSLTANIKFNLKPRGMIGTSGISFPHVVCLFIYRLLFYVIYTHILWILIFFITNQRSNSI